MTKRNRKRLWNVFVSSEFIRILSTVSSTETSTHLLLFQGTAALSAGWKTWVKSLEELPLWPQLPLCIYLVLHLGTEAPQGVNDLRAKRNSAVSAGSEW